MSDATPPATTTGRRAVYATALLAVTYFLYFSWVSLARYGAFDFGDFDFALKTQILEAARRGSVQQTLVDLPFFANHANWIVFAAMPLHLAIGPIALLLFQTFCHALATWPLFLLARRHLGPWPAFLVVLAFLHHPALVGGQLYEVHPETWAIPALLGAIYAIKSRRPFTFAACSIAAILCKEDLPAAIALLSLYAAFRAGRTPPSPCRYERLRWLAPALIAVLYTLAMISLKHYAAPHASLGHAGAYAYLFQPGEMAGALPTGAEVVRLVFTHPLRCLSTILSSPDITTRLLYPVQLLAPLLFLPLLGRAGFLLALPFLVVHLCSSRPQEWSMGYQYNTITLPFLIWAAIDGVRRLDSRFRLRPPVRIWLCGALAAACILANVGLARSRCEPSLWLTYDWLLDSSRTRPDASDRGRARLLQQLPPAAPTVASFAFLSRLAGEHHPLASMHFALAGVKAPGTAPYTLPADISACLIDFKDPLNLAFWLPATPPAEEGSDARLRRMLSSHGGQGPWQAVERINSMALFVRPDLDTVSAPYSAPAPELSYHDLQISMDTGTRLERVGLPAAAAPGTPIPVEFHWTLTGAPRNYWVRLWLSPSSHTATAGSVEFFVDAGLAFPTIAPPSAVMTNAIDRFALLCDLPAGTYTLRFFVFDRSAAILGQPLTAPLGQALDAGTIRIGASIP